MKLEPKIQNPLTIKISSNHGNEILAGDDAEKDYPLLPGAMIGGEHYGFIFIIDKNGKQTEDTYPTQCRIQAVGIEHDELRIYEENKYIPWKFKPDGTFISGATFLLQSNRDRDFLMDSCGIIEPKEIEKINSYVKKLKR